MGAPPKELVDAIVNSLHRQDGWDRDFDTHAASRVHLSCPTEPDLLSVYIRDDADRLVAKFGGIRFSPFFGCWRRDWRKHICDAWRSVYVPAEKRREVEAVRRAVSALNGAASQ